MLMYVGATPDGRQFVHVFVGDESRVAMELTGGAVMDMAPVLDVLDKTRPAIMVFNVVKSEQAVVEECSYNMEQLGFPIRPPVMNAFFYGKQPSPESVNRPMFQGGTVEPTRQAPTSPQRPKEVTVCKGCGDSAVQLGPEGVCEACAAIQSGIVATMPLTLEAERLMAQVADCLVHLRTLGVPVEIAKDPDMLRNTISVRCGDSAFERLNL